MSPAARVLRLFVDVKKREVEPAILFFLFWFLVIVVFWVLKPLKTGFFIDHLGARIELYAKLANIGVAVLAVIAFSYLFDKLGSRKLIFTLCGAFIAALISFTALLGGAGPPPVLVNWSFYLFGDLWTTVWVTTFWAYLNELTRTGQSKRLYGLIGGGGVIGGLVGATTVAALVENEQVGVGGLLVGAAIVTLVIGLIAWRIEMLVRQPEPAIGRERSVDRIHAEQKTGTAGDRGKGIAAIEGAKLAFASKYLLAIVMIVFLYEFASQILDYQFKTELEALEGEEAISGFYARVGMIINTVSIITQFFLVSFIIRKFGITTALLVLPAAMMISSGVYFLVPVLWAGSLLTISDNAFSYSINQTSRETLYVPTSPDVKYKARAFANMFVQRFGKGIAILMALGLAAFPIRFLSILAGIVIVIWAGFAWYAGRRFDGMSGETAERRLEEALP
ncbi:MAG TPA: Npt1/Npt2 family nucleotide transporter [Gemmatimonadota bacterium]|nr:Npt1/Npt2 family nucleotide transporter [Gemmatimonadota bacterium]